MAIRIKDSHFNRIGTVVSATDGTDIDISGGSFTHCGKVIELREPQNLVQFLGLTNDTPPTLVRELLEFAASSSGDQSSVEEKARSSGLLDWLGAGGDVASLVAGAIAVAQSPVLSQILRALPH